MEKNNKDRIIARQSMSKLSLEYFKECGICPSLSDIIKITAMLEHFIIDGYSKELINKFEVMDDYIQKQYKG